jgi:hypothetical protein
MGLPLGTFVYRKENGRYLAGSKLESTSTELHPWECIQTRFVSESYNLDWSGIMFSWITREGLKSLLKILFSVLMVICLFIDRIDLSIFSVLMLILMEIEKITDRPK